MSGPSMLGGQRYTWVADLAEREAISGHPACAWKLMRRDGDGSRFLLQLWDPRPTDKELDQIKETFLGRFLDGEPWDPEGCRFGFDEGHIWFLQELPGLPLLRLAAEWTPEQRRAFGDYLETVLAQTAHPRLLCLDVIGLKPGLTLIPRVIGPAPKSNAEFMENLSALEALPPSGPPNLPFQQPRELSDPPTAPIRGRSQELTVLKSLMFGLSAPAPMERITVIQGEEGLGQEYLAAWAAASAQSEGIWVHHLETLLDEEPDAFLERLLQSLLSGTEADLYAQRPDVARTISRRVPAFGFLAGLRPQGKGGPVESEEIHAALSALEFATAYHHRLIHLSTLERASAETLGLIRDLVQGSKIPWLLCATRSPRLRPLLSAFRGESQEVSIVNLDRMEDVDLRAILGDLLGPHDLPKNYQTELFHRSLGNPGLLLSFLELAQQEGTIALYARKWVLVPGHHHPPRAQEDLIGQILMGRLQRLGSAASVLVRLLALADHPLDPAVLGAALGLGGDPLDDALSAAVNSRLVQMQDGHANIPDVRLRELVLSNTPQPELKRLARALLGAMDHDGRAMLSVRLNSLANDDATALAQVMQAIETQTLAPLDAQHIVDQALELNPTPTQQVRLWEFLADAWSKQRSAPQVLESLGLALAAMEGIPESESKDGQRAGQMARLLRKKARQEIRLRRFVDAQGSIHQASDLLATIPLHPEQPRLRLALGRVYLLQGFHQKGLRALEEGLQLLSSGTTTGNRIDQMDLLLELGQALAHQSQFQRAASMLQSAQRLLEHEQNFKGLVGVQIALGHVYMAQGQPEPAHTLFQEALHTSRVQGSLEGQAMSHLSLGTYRSVQQWLGPAMSHLDLALERFQRLEDRVMTTLTRIWQARTLAALGDFVEAEHTLLQVLMVPQQGLTPLEQGDQAFIQGEVAAFQSAWRDSSRLFQNAALLFEASGLAWRQRLSLLRHLQAEAQEAMKSKHQDALEPCWTLLELLKGPVEGSGSRWLELEWHKAHSLLLSNAEMNDVVATETLMAWGEVGASARELRFPAVVLEASAQGADLLLKRGEKLGARSKLQDAFQSFQELWTRVPESHETLFLGRADIHRFRQAVEGAGLRFILPERVDPLADWTASQANIPMAPPPSATTLKLP